MIIEQSNKPESYLTEIKTFDPLKLSDSITNMINDMEYQAWYKKASSSSTGATMHGAFHAKDKKISALKDYIKELEASIAHRRPKYSIRDAILDKIASMGPCVMSSLTYEVLEQVPEVDLQLYKSQTIAEVNKLLAEGYIQLYETGDAFEMTLSGYQLLGLK